MPRTARQAPAGWTFHALDRGNGRMGLFGKDADYAAFVAVLAEAHAAVPPDLFAWCLMPDHWRLVLRPRGDGDLGRFAHRLTTTHARRRHAHRHGGGGGHVYQGTYKSFPVQDNGCFLAACRYVERNPPRAGLVGRAEAWPWSSLGRRVGAAPPLPLVAWPVPRPPEGAERVNRPQADAEVGALRASASRGRPFGDDQWCRTAADRLDLAGTLRPRGRPKKAENA